ncbi:hypothetical protein [Nocardioides nanhaiensis]
MKLTRSLAAAATAALAFSLTACGGDDGASAPDSASVEDFCDAYTSYIEDLLDDIDMSDPSAIETPSAEEAVDGIKEWADELAETGTPEDMPDEARQGFEDFIDGAQEITADDLEDPSNLEALEEEFGGDPEAAQALTEYTNENCGNPMEDMMGEMMEEMPDMPEMPSDLPSDLELPSDFPSELLTEVPTE